MTDKAIVAGTWVTVTGGHAGPTRGRCEAAPDRSGVFIVDCQDGRRYACTTRDVVRGG